MVGGVEVTVQLLTAAFVYFKESIWSCYWANCQGHRPLCGAEPATMGKPRGSRVPGGHGRLSPLDMFQRTREWFYLKWQLS